MNTLPKMRREPAAPGDYGVVTRMPAYMAHPGHARLERQIKAGKVQLGVKVHIKYKDGTMVDKTI